MKRSDDDTGGMVMTAVPQAVSRMAELALAAMQPEALSSDQLASILDEFVELKACVH